MPRTGPVGHRRLVWAWAWILGLLAVAALGGWAALGEEAIAVGAPVVAGVAVVVVVKLHRQQRVLDRSWAWRWFETLTRAVHGDPSGRQVRSLLDALHAAPPRQIRQTVQLTFLAFAVQIRDRIAAAGREVDPQEIVADVRRRAIAALGPHDDEDPYFADDADVILLRDLHTPVAELDADQEQRLVSFVPLFAAVMCETPDRDLPRLRKQVTRALTQQRKRQRHGPSAAATTQPGTA